jgi:hypothetical protein
VTAFNLTFQKKLFTCKEPKYGYLLAKCSDGKFLAQAEAKFLDGTKIGPVKIGPACTPKCWSRRCLLVLPPGPHHNFLGLVLAREGLPSPSFPVGRRQKEPPDFPPGGAIAVPEAVLGPAASLAGGRPPR